MENAFATGLLARIEKATRDPPGVTRDSYGPGEQRAHDIVREAGIALGLEDWVDAAGNLYLTLPGRDRHLPVLVFGSHLDSVAHGGNYDGAAGVVAGLAVQAALLRAGEVPAHDLTVIALRAEEAVWFPLSYPGAEAALGRLPPAALEARRADTGLTLAQHLRDRGFDPEALARSEMQIAPDRIAAFVELHIEQGPRLVARHLPVGIVSAINGGFRYPRARCLGAYAHSGAEPRFSRQDAVLGFADLVTATEGLWDRLEAEGHELTITFGRVETDPAQHGGSRVSGEVGFSLDLRCEHPEVLSQIEDALRAALPGIEAARRVRFDLGPRFDWAPAQMDRGLMAQLGAAARRAGVEVGPISSGAGHDTAVFASAGIPAAMVFLRNRNGSHNPDEALDPADLARGIAVLTEFARSFRP